MPDAPAGGAPSAGVGSGSPSPSTGPSSPQITFGGGTSGDIKTPQPQVETPPAETKEEPFEFTFEGDPETYRETLEQKADKETSEAGYDASKPFDPRIKEALKANPDLLKQVERNHFELRNWQKSGFKNPQEVTAFKGNVDNLAKSLGRSDGLQGLDAIKAEAGEWSTIMGQFKAGDPAVMNNFWTNNPEGMSKLMAPALNKFSELNPAGFAHELSKIFISTLNSVDASGTTSIGAFNQLAEIIKDPAQVKLLNRIHATLSQLFDASQKAPDESQIKNPQLEAREKNVQSQEQKIYVSTLEGKLRPSISNAIDQGLKKMLKGKNIPKETMEDLRRDVFEKFKAEQMGDDTYRKNAWELLQAKDEEGLTRAYRSSIVRLLPRVLRRQMRIFSGISGGNSDRNAEAQALVESGAGGSGAAPTKMPYRGQLVQGGPPPAKIDYAGMRERFGRLEASEMLSRREFMQKGDPKTIWTW